MAVAKPVTRTVVATPTWGFPVTDEINRLTTEGAGNLSKLASLQAIMNGLLTPVWTPIPLASPFAPYGSGYATPAYCVQGSWVWLRGLARQTQAADLTAVTTMGTLPVEARPAVSISVLILMLTGGSAGVAPGKRMQIGSAGAMSVYPTATESLSQNAWVSLDGTKFNMIGNV